MLRVVVHYVPGLLRHETEDALAVYSTPRSSVEYRPVDPRDPTDYGKKIAAMWRECAESSDDLVLIEHDVEIGPTTLFDFRACSHLYCGNPFAWVTNVGVAMGCTRFRAEFIEEFAFAVDEALAIAPHFRQFDVIFQRRVLAKRYGAQPHVHAPVVHLNEEKRLRPGASPVPLEGVPVDDIGVLL